MSITPESVQQLLSSQDFGDRLRGVNQLRQLEPPTAFNLIQMVVKDLHVRVRYAAISQLGVLGQQDRNQALDILRDVIHNDPEPDVQAAAADALGALQLTEAFDDLKKLYYKTSEWLVQMSIIAVIGEMKTPETFGLLENALTSENPLVRMMAIGSFGELGDPNAVSLLIPQVTDPDWQIRYTVAQALGRLGGEQSHSILESLAHDPIEQVAQEAKNHLSQNSV